MTDAVAAFLGSMPGFDLPGPVASSPMLPPAAPQPQPEPEPEPEPAAALPALRRQRASEARAAQRTPAAATVPAARTALPSYDVKPIDLDGSGRLVNIHEDARSNAGGVGGELWDGAIVLARWLQGQLTAPPANTASVLELGAGTGLVGLSAAVLCGAWVVLTDRGKVFGVTQLNAERNRPAVDAAGGSVECVELDWLVAAQMDASPDRLPDARPRSERPVLLPQHSQHAVADAGWDFVVGSDILYDARMYKVLAKLINAAVRVGESVDGSGLTLGSRTVCALSYSVSPHSIKRFFELCEGYGLTVTQLTQIEMMAAVGEPVSERASEGDGDDDGEEQDRKSVV
jgi:predicted nicotinamide N-methyase